MLVGRVLMKLVLEEEKKKKKKKKNDIIFTSSKTKFGPRDKRYKQGRTWKKKQQ
jgi:hypothetical protein